MTIFQVLEIRREFGEFGGFGRGVTTSAAFLLVPLSVGGITFPPFFHSYVYMVDNEA